MESVIGSVRPVGGKLAVLTNGVYGKRMLEIAKYLQIPSVDIESEEVMAVDVLQLEQVLAEDSSITQVAVVHCETTTGMLNHDSSGSSSSQKI
ncbi:MAG: hypothetical protein HRU05_04470 [Oceanospirillaceae bacterium]|nr:hypothetical protein [Oceanospirillaceae bacterium]